MFLAPWNRPKQLFGTRAKRALVSYLAPKIEHLVGDKSEEVVEVLLEDCSITHLWSYFRDAEGKVHDCRNLSHPIVDPTFPVEGFIVHTSWIDRKDLLASDSET